MALPQNLHKITAGESDLHTQSPVQSSVALKKGVRGLMCDIDEMSEPLFFCFSLFLILSLAH